jgi:hypothetical protein
MTMPQMTNVISKNLKSIGYDGRALFVAFKSGGIYAYNGVPEDVFAVGLMSPSPGKWFRETIKGKFSYRKVEPDAESNPS